MTTMKNWLLTLLVALSFAAIASRLAENPREASPLDLAFLLDAAQGMTILFPRGPSEGTYVTLKDGVAIYRSIDGGFSDNRLAPGSESGNYTFRDGCLTLYRPGLTDGLALKLTIPPRDLRGEDIRYVLEGPGLTMGFAPVQLPVPLPH